MAYLEKVEVPLVPLKGPEAHMRQGTLARRNARIGILLVLPCIVLVCLFFIAPLLMTIWMSFTNWPLLGSVHFIGIENYLTLLKDSQFWQSLGFTLKYTVVVTPAIFLAAFGLALLVRQKKPGVGFFRTVYFMPVVLPLSTASLLWLWMFDGQVGIFDAILERLGIIHQPIIWLANPTIAIISIGVMVVWKTVGATMLFLLIGMNGIPEELYEAASVDGAGWWRRLGYITLPLLRRTFALALVISVIGSMLAFDQFYIMTQGGPQDQTITAVYWIFNNSFVYFKLGYGAALSLILLVILLIFTVIQLYLLRDDTQA